MSLPVHLVEHPAFQERGRGRVDRRSTEQVALVRHREGVAVAGEELRLGARPGVLGVEQEPVVVEDHGGGTGHGGP